MKLTFLSLPYFLCLFLSAAFVCLLYFPMRKKLPVVKKLYVLTLMLANIAQHLCKGIVWPHLYDTGFGLINTAYNVCAFLILVSPLVLFTRSQTLKDFVAVLGTAGPLLAVAVPYWFNGQDLFQWEVLRFYVCHVLLIATSLLPLLFGLHKLSYKSFYKVPFCFLVMICLILANDGVCYGAGLVGGEDLFSALYALNPCWSMHPAVPAGFEWVQTALEALSPFVFYRADGVLYLPVLWYAVPMYFVIALVYFFAGLLFDFPRLRADLRAMLEKKK